MPSRKGATGPTPIDSIKHGDKRHNLPTADAQEFVTLQIEEAREILVERNASLDPQLVWRGKYGDESAAAIEDAATLVADAPPIYIQEKIDPRVLVENLRRTAAQPEDEPELTLFDTFDGLDELDLVDFYQHQSNWSNRMILGDSLEVMGSLAEREELRGQVQMIYIDPPYGIKFGSNWQASTRKRDVKDGKVEDAAREAEQIKAFRDTWELGIHSYLSYLRDRLLVARELLTESGSCFVQIGDENVHLVRSLMDEVFGSDNFVGHVIFKKTSGATFPIPISHCGSHRVVCQRCGPGQVPAALARSSRTRGRGLCICIRRGRWRAPAHDRSRTTWTRRSARGGPRVSTADTNVASRAGGEDWLLSS